MQHNDIRRRLVDFVDGELGREDEAAVETHLGNCDACRREVAELRSSLRAVREGMAPAPERWMPLNAATVEARRARRRSRRLATGAAGVFAACALAIVFNLPRTADAPAPVDAERAAALTEVEDLRARIDALEAELAQLKRPRVYVVPTDTGVPSFSAREEVAAILVQAGKSLEDDFGFVEDAHQRYRYAIARYGDTKAAADARARIAHD